MRSLLSNLLDRWLGPSDHPNEFVEPTFHRFSFTTSLPSVLQGADFHATFSVTWYDDSGTPEGSAERTVRSALQRWATEQTSKISISRIETAQNDLSYAILRLQSVRGTGIHLSEGAVTLTATDDARKAALAWDESQRAIALERVRQETELDHLRYLRERIFSEPGLARVYWLKQHPNALGDLVDDRFERLASKLRNNGAHDDNAIADLVTDFLRGLDDAERRYLLAQVSRVFVSFDRQDLVDRLPNHHADDVRTTTESPAGGLP